MPTPQIKPTEPPPSRTQAIFELSHFALIPHEIESGESATVSVDVTNTGGVKGTHTVTLEIDGTMVKTKAVTLAAGDRDAVVFEISRESPGTYHLDINGLSGKLRVLEPAGFELAQLVITPETVATGEAVNVRVSIKNTGEVEGSHQVVLRIDGGIAQVKEVRLSPGTTETVEFTLEVEMPGTHLVEVNGLGKTFLVLTPVATVTISPPLLLLSVEGTNTGTLHIEARDAEGNMLDLTGRDISFRISQPDVITVSNSGVVTVTRAQESLDETPYVWVSVDGVDSQCSAVVRVTQTDLPVSPESFVTFRGQHVTFYMPEEAAGIDFGQVIREYDVVGATDVAYRLQEELTGVVPFRGTTQQFVGEPGESEPMSICGANGNPIRLGCNVSKPPPHNNCIREPDGHPHWGVMWHEMGHNFTLTPVRFLQLYGGGSRSVQLVYCETMASLALVYAQERIVSELGHFGLGDFTVTSIGGRNYGALLFNKENGLRDLADYKASGAHFTEIDSGWQISVLFGMLVKLGETYGWDIFPRFFKIFWPADEPWDLFDQADTETKKHTVTVCALSIAARTDLREQFREWNFPVDEAFYQQIEPQIEAAILN